MARCIGPGTAAWFAVVARRPVLTLSLLFVVCVAVFLATLRLPRADNLVIGSDGILYYSYVRSLVIDGDIDLADEYAHFSRFPGFGDVPKPTPTGRLPNRMPIGLALLWVPFFLAGHATAWLFGASLDGYSTIHQTAVCLGSMLYGGVGLLLSYRLCREHADKVSALVAVVILWFGSNAIYYLVAEPSMSHMTSLGLVAALLAWWRFEKGGGGAGYWTGLGILGGLAALVRPQDGLFLLLPVLDWACAERARLRAGRGGLERSLAGPALMICVAGALYALQLWAWWLLYGSILESSYMYAGAHHFAWLQPQLFAVLFSFRHGLFTWHPVYLAAAAGLWWLAYRDRAYTVLLLVAFALQVYVVAAWNIWWQGDAFGGRMFLSCFPFFAVGLGQLVMRLRRVHWAAVAVPALLLVLWNGAFLVQYRFGFIPMGDAISARQLLVDKLTLPLDVWRRLRQRTP